MRGWTRGLLAVGIFALLLWSLLGHAGQPPTAMRFEVSLARGLLAAPQDGRMLVVLAREGQSEPRLALGKTGMHVPPVLGRDALALKPGTPVVLDRTSAIYPLADLTKLPRGVYRVQAVFDYNRDLRFPNAPDNLVSEPSSFNLDPAVGGTVKLELTRKLLADELPAESENIRFVKLRSDKLSKFHGRPIYLRAGVLLPSGYASQSNRQYPLRVHIGGFGSRYTAIRSLQGSAQGMIVLHLDGAGPLGDPYQVNSANHGPYGDAITQELIPYVEKRFRGIGKSHARVLDGASTGGWVSLALQIFYPDFFNGAWSHCPDPVDFRAFELIDIYHDANAFVNRFGFERPASRTLEGDVEFTVRNEVQRECVLGRGGRWELSGKDWGSWNATFGPRGKDGLPVPLWDGRTGQIDRTVLEHWKQYDLRLHLEKNWATLAPKLQGKLRIWVGEADEYFLNNAVHLLDDFLQEARPAFGGKITFGPRQGHSWQGLGENAMLAEMAQTIERGAKGQ